MPDDYGGINTGYNHGEFLRQQAIADQEWKANWKATTHLPPIQQWQIEDLANEALTKYKKQNMQGGGRRMRYKSTRRRGKTNRRRVKTHRRRHRKH